MCCSRLYPYHVRRQPCSSRTARRTRHAETGGGPPHASAASSTARTAWPVMLPHPSRISAIARATGTPTTHTSARTVNAARAAPGSSPASVPQTGTQAARRAVSLRSRTRRRTTGSGTGRRSRPATSSYRLRTSRPPRRPARPYPTRPPRRGAPACTSAPVRRSRARTHRCAARLPGTVESGNTTQSAGRRSPRIGGSCPLRRRSSAPACWWLTRPRRQGRRGSGAPTHARVGSARSADRSPAPGGPQDVESAPRRAHLVEHGRERAKPAPKRLSTNGCSAHTAGARGPTAACRGCPGLRFVEPASTRPKRPCRSSSCRSAKSRPRMAGNASSCPTYAARRPLRRSARGRPRPAAGEQLASGPRQARGPVIGIPRFARARFDPARQRQHVGDREGTAGSSGATRTSNCSKRTTPTDERATTRTPLRSSPSTRSRLCAWSISTTRRSAAIVKHQPGSQSATRSARVAAAREPPCGRRSRSCGAQ